MTPNSYSQQNNHATLKIDHVLIAVTNLDSAISEYEKYGFTVVDGGPPKEAFNALIFLQDGSAIELIGQDRVPGIYTFLNQLRITRLFGMMKDRISAFRNVPEGMFNYCLHTEDLKATYEFLKQNGLDVARPIALSRMREDNVRIGWELIGSSPYDLPFFIGDYSPGRLSDPSNTTHKNKATSLDSIVIMTNSFDKYYKFYNVIYNQVPEFILKNSLRTAVYKLSGQSVILNESKAVLSFFTRNDSSAPTSIHLSCGHGPDFKWIKLNKFCTLTG